MKSLKIPAMKEHVQETIRNLSIFNDFHGENGETHFYYKKDPKTTLRAMSGGSTGPWASESRMRPGPDLDTWCRHVETQTRRKSWILEGSLPTNGDPTNRDAIYFYSQQLVRLSDQKSPEVSRVHGFGMKQSISDAEMFRDESKSCLQSKSRRVLQGTLVSGSQHGRSVTSFMFSLAAECHGSRGFF